jgi:hypothetical protein
LIISTTLKKGAPDEACSDLQPAGHDEAIALKDQPFKIVSDSFKYGAGDTVSVSIKKTGLARDGDHFKGFLIVAKAKNDFTGNNVGQFLPDDDKTSKTIKCKTVASAITHVDSRAKESVSFSWTGGDSFKGDVIFTGTIVRNFTEYYSGVKSPSITIV